MRRIGRPGLCASLALCVTTLTGQPGSAQTIERWRVESEPVLDIGVLDGPDEYILVNPLAATVLSDGTVVIQNSTRNLFEIRYYDAAGVHLTNASRWGEGPFEFHYPIAFHRLGGDSVLVVGRDGRFAVFGPRGERVRQGRVGFTEYLPVEGALSISPTSLAPFKTKASGAGPDPGTHRSEVLVYHYDLQSGATDSLTTVLARATHYERNPSGVWIYSVPFAPETQVAGGAGVLWIGDTSERQIRGYRDPGGSLHIVFPVPFAQREVSRDHKRRMREAYSNYSSGDRQKRWARYASSMDFPESMPSFGLLRVDRTGNVWLQEYEPFWAEGDQRWSVHSPSGLQIAEVRVSASALPPCARRMRGSCDSFSGILEIGEDYMLVVQSDEFDAMHVRQYKIHKGS